MARKDQIAGWGRVAVPGVERRTEDLDRESAGAVLVRGLGRSYGDASLPAPSDHVVLCSVPSDRILAFDPEQGLLRAEAGLSLQQISRLFQPRGFCSPVLPGTHFLTLGGMVAADVHAKNHHVAGCFGQHLRQLRMRLADGRIVDASPQRHPDLFWATVGGMGLTGHILEVEFKLQPIPSQWIWQETERIANLDQFLSSLKHAAQDWPYTMGWIDCLSRGEAMGRGVLYRGRWATAAEAPQAPPKPGLRPQVPFSFPSWVLGPTSVRLFNSAIYRRQWRKLQMGIVPPQSFFHPLDVIRDWNRIYGPRGFTQHQSVIPDSAGPEAVRGFLELLSARGGASFLCVIKDCGRQGQGMLSFPLKGTSIALDIAIRDDTQELIDALNERVIEVGGRVYLAKDMFTRREHFQRMERERLPVFVEARAKWDPDHRIRSALSVRLLGDEA